MMNILRRMFNLKKKICSVSFFFFIQNTNRMHHESNNKPRFVFALYILWHFGFIWLDCIKSQLPRAGFR